MSSSLLGHGCSERSNGDREVEPVAEAVSKDGVVDTLRAPSRFEIGKCSKVGIQSDGFLSASSRYDAPRHVNGFGFRELVPDTA